MSGISLIDTRRSHSLYPIFISLIPIFTSHPFYPQITNQIAHFVSTCVRTHYHFLLFPQFAHSSLYSSLNASLTLSFTPLLSSHSLCPVNQPPMCLPYGNQFARRAGQSVDDANHSPIRPQGAQINGVWVFVFGPAARFKNFCLLSFSKSSQLTFPIVSVLIVSMGRVAPSLFCIDSDF